MTFRELELALLNEQTNFCQSLKEQPERRAKALQGIEKILGKIRSGYPAPTAESQRDLAFRISDETYSDLQRSLNRQKKLLSLYRKQFTKTT